MPASNPLLVSRLIGATLLTVLTASGLYFCTIGAHWPTSENAQVWACEGLYALVAGVLHFLLWPLWHRAPTAAPMRQPLRSR